MALATAGRFGLGATATVDLSTFRRAAAAPAWPITGREYQWPHPSGLFTVRISADGTANDWTPLVPASDDTQKATATVVSVVWYWPLTHSDPNGFALPVAVTGNEIPDATLLQTVSSFFAFNKGLVFTGSGTQGQNTLQTTTINNTSGVVSQNQPNAAAQYQAMVTTGTGALTDAINTIPTTTQFLTAAFQAANITGPGVARSISSATPQLESLRATIIAQLRDTAAQFVAQWKSDLTANPNAIPAEIASNQTTLKNAVSSAVSQLQTEAAKVAHGSVGSATVTPPKGDGATGGTATPPQGGGGTPTIADSGSATGGGTTPPGSPATAGFGGIAALVLGGGLLFALTRKRKR